MRVKHAKNIARQWVTEHAASNPGFAGAFLHGSINWLTDEDDLPATSDVDVMIVLTDSEPPAKLGKFEYQGVLLEISYLPFEQAQSPETVLSQSHLAGSFHVNSIIADPTGHLTRLQIAVANDYARRDWVYTRCQAVEARLLRYVDSVSEATAFHDQVIRWVFATGLTTHILLVAGLKNPTVRRRYMAVQELLAGVDRLEFHESLLALLGCAEMTPARVAYHLEPLPAVLNAAASVLKSPFPFASDIQPDAHPIAIDGSQKLIVSGFHREAVFWIVVTYSRCMIVLDEDAPPAAYAQYDPGFRELLSDLGITSFVDLQQRSAQIKDFLPHIWAVAAAIMAANPEIQDE
jgi:hypothetical protein